MLTHVKAMNSFKKKISKLNSIIGAEARVVLMDVPIYGNIGDILIMHGTISFLNDNDYKVLGFYSAYGELPRLSSDTVILLQGGGNFGDLYPLHQSYRERVVNNYRDNKIVILPQTIYFKDDNNLHRSAKYFLSHEKLYIACRDEKSLSLSKTFTEKNLLLPDMAHFLYEIRSKKSDIERQEVLHFYRKDCESKQNCKNKVNSNSIDWSNSPLVYKFVIKFFIIFNKKFGKRVSESTQLFMNNVWISFTYVLANFWMKKISRYEKIITDRLHVHIASCLQDKNNTFYDNSYGKNSSYFFQWTKDSCISEFQKR